MAFVNQPLEEVGLNTTGKNTSFSLVFHVNLQCILSGMNYIVALGQTQQKNCVGLYVRQQKVNGSLRIPDAVTLFNNSHTYTLSSKTDHKATEVYI